jgi:mutator protein MutT
MTVQSPRNAASNPPPRIIEVSAGLIFKEGRLLITQRMHGSHLAGKWEFPGGKREAGETFEQCLVRELREELGVETEVGQLIESLTHDYPEKTVHLRFFRCRLVRGEPRPIGCAACKWVTPETLAGHDFPGADARLLDILANTPALWTDPGPRIGVGAGG